MREREKDARGETDIRKLEETGRQKDRVRERKTQTEMELETEGQNETEKKILRAQIGAARLHAAAATPTSNCPRLIGPDPTPAPRRATGGPKEPGKFSGRLRSRPPAAAKLCARRTAIAAHSPARPPPTALRFSCPWVHRGSSHSAKPSLHERSGGPAAMVRAHGPSRLADQPALFRGPGPGGRDEDGGCGPRVGGSPGALGPMMIGRLPPSGGPVR